jgi:hypothetical protein
LTSVLFLYIFLYIIFAMGRATLYKPSVYAVRIKGAKSV